MVELKAVNISIKVYLKTDVSCSLVYGIVSRRNPIHGKNRNVCRP